MMRKVIVVLLAVMFSCDSAEEITQDFVPETNTDFLAGEESKRWILFQQNGGDPNSCYDDNVYIFSREGSFTEIYGQVKCFETESDRIEGTWTFNSPETVLQISREGGLPVNYRIGELTPDRLDVSYTLGGREITEEYIPEP